MRKEAFSLFAVLGPRATVHDAELFPLVHASLKASAFVLGKLDIGEGFFSSDSSPALRSVFDLSTHPDQRCLLISHKNALDMFDRHASFYIAANWSPATEE